MPQLYAGRIVEPVQSVPAAPYYAAVIEDARRGPILAPEPPDQTLRQRADERMVQVAFAPDGKRPALSLQIQVLDPVTLGRQHLPHVPGRRLELFQLLGMMLLEHLRYRLLPLAIRLNPTQFSSLRVRNDQ